MLRMHQTPGTMLDIAEALLPIPVLLRKELQQSNIAASNAEKIQQQAADARAVLCMTSNSLNCRQERTKITKPDLCLPRDAWDPKIDLTVTMITCKWALDPFTGILHGHCGIHKYDQSTNKAQLQDSHKLIVEGPPDGPKSSGCQ